jgi:hypothetical protein
LNRTKRTPNRSVSSGSSRHDDSIYGGFSWFGFRPDAAIGYLQGKTKCDQLTPPGWHQDTLAEREAAIISGEETLEDWETAKLKIERDIE